MADRDREWWTRIVATFEESGHSQQEFAKEQELDKHHPAGNSNRPGMYVLT
jgi:hypothetical protein